VTSAAMWTGSHWKFTFQHKCWHAVQYSQLRMNFIILIFIQKTFI
jgi:hypothetical protein